MRLILFKRLHLHRSLSTMIDLGAQMKYLNDKGQYRKAIDLFEKSNENLKMRTLALNQALKSFMEMNDLQRAKNLHKTLPENLTNNPFIRTNLIRTYSNFWFLIRTINQSSSISFLSEMWWCSASERNFRYDGKENNCDVLCHARR